MGSLVSKLRRAAQGVRSRFRRGEPSATDKNVLLTRPAFSNDQDAIDVPPTPAEEFEPKPALGLRTDAAAGVGPPHSTAAKTARSPNPFGDDDDDGPGPAGAAPKRPSANLFNDDNTSGGFGVPPRKTGSTGGSLRPAIPAAFGSDDDDDDNDFVPRRRVPSQSAAATAARRSPWDDEPDAVSATPSTGRPEPSANPFAESDDEAAHDGARSAATPTQADGLKRPATTLGAHKRRLCTVRIEASYSASGEQLELRIFEVEGLLERKYGKPDLYVKLYLSPDPKKTTKRKTAVVKHNAAPVYNELFSIPLPSAEVGQRTLRIALWTQGKLSNHVLGEANVPLAPYAGQANFRFTESVVLIKRPGALRSRTAGITSEDDGGNAATDDADIVSVAESERSAKTYTSSGRTNPFDDSDDDSGRAGDATKPNQSKDPRAKPLCRVHLGAGYSPDAGLLRVNVMEVADLVWKEDTKPDLYVKMFVAPDPKKSTKRKTHVLSGTLTPHFDELFEWKLPAVELLKRKLIVSLCEEGTLTNDILGEMSIDLRSLADGRTEWNDWYTLYRKTSSRFSLKGRR